MTTDEPTFLPDLYLPSRANQQWDTSGIDSFETCLDQQHYQSYPHTIDYRYNSRGFRDAEWPNDLSNVIWCIGDSFTVGLGSPLEHTWPCVLQQRTGRRTINVGLDGASNNWIARVAEAILTQFPDAIIVTYWSFLHRRESDPAPILETKFQNLYHQVREWYWPDCNSSQDLEKLPIYIKRKMMNHRGWKGIIAYGDERLTHHVRSTVEEDINNTQQCVARLPNHVIHTAIPGWAPADSGLNFSNIILTTQLDYARDNFHYDILTSHALVDCIIPALALNATD